MCFSVPCQEWDLDDVGDLNGALQIPKTYTHYASVALFFFFGLKSLYDAFFKKDDVSARGHARLHPVIVSAQFPACTAWSGSCMLCISLHTRVQVACMRGWLNSLCMPNASCHPCTCTHAWTAGCHMIPVAWRTARTRPRPRLHRHVLACAPAGRCSVDHMKGLGAHPVHHRACTAVQRVRLLVANMPTALGPTRPPLQGEESELEQVEHELSDLNKGKNTPKELKEMDKRKTNFMVSMLGMIFSQIFLKSFTLTFLAEWGDRSQIATIGCVRPRGRGAGGGGGRWTHWGEANGNRTALAGVRHTQEWVGR